jgi:hypothetical protein
MNRDARQPIRSAVNLAVSSTSADDTSLPFFDHPRFQEIYKEWLERGRILDDLGATICTRSTSVSSSSSALKVLNDCFLSIVKKFSHGEIDEADHHGSSGRFRGNREIAGRAKHLADPNRRADAFQQTMLREFARPRMPAWLYRCRRLRRQLSLSRCRELSAER